jgi:hypothetical protein
MEEELNPLGTTPWRGWTAGFALLTGAMIGGCAATTTTSEPAPAAASTPAPVTTPASISLPPKATETDEVVALLAYYQRVSAMSAEDLRREYNAVNAAFNKDKAENQRLKLALLLSVPQAAYGDDKRLLALLESAPTRNAPADSPQRELLTLLQKLTAERVRQVSQAKDEQKRTDTQTRDEQKRLEQQVKDEQKRADELQQKLDALLAIDRDLRHRAPQRGAPRTTQTK